MHLVESFALNTGLKIGKPYIYDKFVPLAFQGKYITLQPFGKYDSRKYDYWEEVIDILMPLLIKNDIRIVQLGTPDEKLLFGCYNMRGKTDFNQAAYLIKNSALHLGIDSFGVHLASGYNKKMVALYCNMLPNNSGPYWGEKNKIIILQPERKEGERPSYSAVEDPKTINKIRPEDIAKSVCKLLGLDLDFPYRTIYVGKEYHIRKVELIPAMFVENWKQLGVESLIVRMDQYFHEENLVQQLKKCNCSIVTDKPINLKILQTFKNKINEFVFFVDEETSPMYFQLLRASGIKYFLVSYLDEEKLNKIKLDYVDVGGIVRKDRTKQEDIKELEGKDLSKIYYKSSSYSIFQDEIYCSNIFADDNHPVKGVRGLDPMPVVNDSDFWDQADSYLLLEKLE